MLALGALSLIGHAAIDGGLMGIARAFWRPSES
jgi:hypothetical protein